MSQARPIYENVASIVLAGGQGTRLHPLTLSRCKPGACFGGKYRLIDVPISNSLNSSIHRIFVLGQFFTNSLQKHLSEAFSYQKLQKGNVEVLTPEETPSGINWFLGTADAVRKNKRYLETVDVEYFLILSGDQLYNLNLLEMIEFAKTSKAELVIAALPVQEKEAKRMGLLQINTSNHITDFIEKPQTAEVLKQFALPSSPSLYLGSMGIYVFKKKALFSLLEKEGNDFGKDLIPKQIQETGTSFAFLHTGYWEDIGTIESYYHANLALTKQGHCLDINNLCQPIYTAYDPLPSPFIESTQIENSLISQGCIIKAKQICRSVIGIQSNIGPNTIIKDSVIIGNHGNIKGTIGHHCILEKTIVDEDVSIGDNVLLLNEKKLEYYDGEQFYIRDGIIVIPSGAKIPNGFRI